MSDADPTLDISNDDPDGPSVDPDPDIFPSGSSVPSDDEESLSFTSLHDLYRNCVKPLEIHKNTMEYLERGVPVNYVDEFGVTALSLLVLHINRGLRYHMYRIPAIASLEDINAPQAEISKVCTKFDAEYQEQVYKCLYELLRKFADPNIIPASCPGIPFDSGWSENYEHKLMQSDQRWNLFSFGGSMEFTTYSIFNPLSRHRPTNSKGVTVVHLVAWRGDAQCLKLVLEWGGDVHTAATDGRNALHFLYLYCNKPDDLVSCTQLLVQQGIDVNAVDSDGHSPLQVLLCHFLVKKSHVKYLANAYTESNVNPAIPRLDHFRDAIKHSIELLVEAGARIDQPNHNMETPLHYIYSRFEHSLRNCEPDFQVKGHYLVPYSFRVNPLVEFSQFLMKLGCQVNAKDSLGRTPLLHLVFALKNLSMDEDLNTNHQLCECFRVLLAEGASVNLKDFDGRTAIHHLVELVCTTRHALKRHLGTMKLLVSHGADLRTRDNHGNGMLHLLLGSSMRAEHMQELLVFLIQCGADPNQTNVDNKYPLNNLMRQHIHHHDPLSLGGISLRLDHYLRTVDLVCRAMSMDSLGYVFSIYRESGFWGVICEEECSVHKLLKGHCQQVRTLKEVCRLSIWGSMGPRFWSECEKLPLPKEIVKYVFRIVT